MWLRRNQSDMDSNRPSNRQGWRIKIDAQVRYVVMKYVAKMQMVIYGIGSIESYEPPRLQLSLTLLMKRKFDWIGEIEIEVFDPALAGTETSVLEALGCSVLSGNENGKREASKPTYIVLHAPL